MLTEILPLLQSDLPGTSRAGETSEVVSSAGVAGSEKNVCP